LEDNSNIASRQFAEMKDILSTLKGKPIEKVREIRDEIERKVRLLLDQNS